MFLPFEEGFSAQCLFQGSQGLFLRSHRGFVPMDWDFMLRLEGMETSPRFPRWCCCCWLQLWVRLGCTMRTPQKVIEILPFDWN